MSSGWTAFDSITLPTGSSLSQGSCFRRSTCCSDKIGFVRVRDPLGIGVVPADGLEADDDEEPSIQTGRTWSVTPRLQTA
eukprot:CAMPEP_0181410586 /NCGR_PEP_ID=MMETSP1110-20121109/7416_1 /TAXON_ID=174948 /ORGANISM="Symbiodinium sp., Strain CCMP421" /LENGTH=79 /DNA_ID=CAMNT_0023533139 /DNA_START=109 /DNA_END=344 /DNA_ORIENTATION=+